ncbi:flavin reductase family protein [Terriglobus roseus]|nr:flavin reductase family protein [Terriglobus roseus]
MSDTHAAFDLRTLSKSDTYKLLASTILPRPIAWITTLDDDGKPNAAPFSFFNVVSADPPLIVVGFSAAPDREGKDTLANICRTGELVVNLVPEELAEAMNITATDAPRGLDELTLAGLATVPSLQVAPPRIAGSPVSLECRTFQIIEPGGSSTILVAKALEMHIRHDAFEDESRLHIDPAQMRLIGRMHGGGDYATTRDMFEIARIPWKEMQSKQS